MGAHAASAEGSDGELRSLRIPVEDTAFVETEYRRTSGPCNSDRDGASSPFSLEDEIDGFQQQASVASRHFRDGRVGEYRTCEVDLFRDEPIASAETNRRSGYVERDMRQRELAVAELERSGKLRDDLIGFLCALPALVFFDSTH